MVWWSPIPVCSSDSPENRLKHSAQSRSSFRGNTQPQGGVQSAFVFVASDWIPLSGETETCVIFFTRLGVVLHCGLFHSGDATTGGSKPFTLSHTDQRVTNDPAARPVDHVVYRVPKRTAEPAVSILGRAQASALYLSPDSEMMYWARKLVTRW
jgi:hypothetical protein